MKAPLPLEVPCRVLAYRVVLRSTEILYHSTLCLTFYTGRLTERT